MKSVTESRLWFEWRSSMSTVSECPLLFRFAFLDLDLERGLRSQRPRAAIAVARLESLPGEADSGGDYGSEQRVYSVVNYLKARLKI